MNTVIPATTENGHMRPDLPKFKSIEVTVTHIIATLSDERIVSVPLWWSWRLEQASVAARENVQIIGAGRTAYWPDVDEHLSVQGFLTGTPAPRPQRQLADVVQGM
ncbi:MAG: DUF2442 domain-containing protein [Caldilineaceae bacterium]|nr:DUF2442 domain-containing protein [Caldilineaceae bacterium]